MFSRSGYGIFASMMSPNVRLDLMRPVVASSCAPIFIRFFLLYMPNLGCSQFSELTPSVNLLHRWIDHTNYKVSTLNDCTNDSARITTNDIASLNGTKHDSHKDVLLCLTFRLGILLLRLISGGTLIWQILRYILVGVSLMWITRV